MWLFQFAPILAVLYLIVVVKNIFKFPDHPEVSEWIKIGSFVFSFLLFASISSKHSTIRACLEI